LKLIDFNYKKQSGEVSTRVLAVTNEPNKFFEGIDISHLSTDEFAEFVNEYSEILDQFKQKQLNLLHSFDLKHNFRRFTPENMFNVEIEHV
jgi:hypothetical protein